ncbi:uncharacterized protein LOC117226908 isoform X3 [Megalopta genalis]|uniref:uncharacterized protein LOC117226908 isoform X3 n=1 Tax=Megalopta genalis TaxID=115081 RepID=UPI003FD58358
MALVLMSRIIQRYYLVAGRIMSTRLNCDWVTRGFGRGRGERIDGQRARKMREEGEERRKDLLDRLTGSTYPSGSWTGKQTSHRRDAWEDTLRLIGEDRRRRDRRHWGMQRGRAGSYVAAKAEAPRDLLFFVQGYMRSRTSLGTGRSMISHCVTDQLIIGRYGVVKQDGGESSLCTDIWTPIGPAPLRCYH